MAQGRQLREPLQGARNTPALTPKNPIKDLSSSGPGTPQLEHPPTRVHLAAYGINPKACSYADVAFLMCSRRQHFGDSVRRYSLQ